MVQEEVDIGTEIGTVQATDEDIGENGMIDYLISCMFKTIFMCVNAPLIL